MLGSTQEAEDVSQETFVRLCGAGLDDRTSDQIVAWIYRTSTRLTIDRLRARRPTLELEQLPDFEGPSLENQIATRQALVLLARRAPRRELELAMLQRLDGLDQKESAEVIGVSERTVRRLLSRFEERVVRLRAELAR